MADFDLGAILNDPTFQTGLGMIGTNQALGPAFQQAAAAAQANKAAQQQNAIRQLQLQQLNARANFNPSQYLLSNQAQNASPQAAGPATQAALAAQQGPQAGAQIAGNTQTPYQAPQGALGNVDIQGMLGAGLKAGMSPEEVQGMAGVIDPMTAIKMKLMSQPALAVAPQSDLVSPGLAQIQQLGLGGQTGSPQAPQGGGAPGALYHNSNLPADSDAAQVINITRAMNLYAPSGPTPDPAKFSALQSMLAQKSGAFQQQHETDVLANTKTQQALVDQIRQQNQTLIQNQRVQENQFKVQSQANELADSLKEQGVPQTEAVLGPVEKLLAKYPVGQLPGVGRVDNLMANHGLGAAMGPEAQMVRQTLAPLTNITLQDRNKSRITTPEFDRIQTEMGAGDFVPEERLRQGIQSFRNILESQKRNAVAGTPPAALSAYENQGGMPLSYLQSGSKAAQPQSTSAPAKTPVRTGMVNGRKVVQYNDGTTAYAN